jgi:hypothetical protein
MNAPTDERLLGRVSPPRTLLRALQPEDLHALPDLHARLGLPSPAPRTLAWALMDNPSRLAVRAEAGWVLERGTQIVGWIGNLPRCYRYRGMPMWGATTTPLIVDPAYREHGVRLMRSFAAQSGPALLMAAAGPYAPAGWLRSLQFRPVSDGGANQRLRWNASGGTSNWWNQASARLRAWAGIGACVEQRLEEVMRQAPAGLRVERLAASDLQDVQDAPEATESGAALARAWQDWDRATRRQPGLWAVRTPSLMAWHLSMPDPEGPLPGFWLLLDERERLLGWCLARVRKQTATRPASAEIADLALHPRVTPPAAAMLLMRVLEWARSWQLRGVEALGWTGMPIHHLMAAQAPDETTELAPLWMLTHAERGVVPLPLTPRLGLTGLDTFDPTGLGEALGARELQADGTQSTSSTWPASLVDVHR